MKLALILDANQRSALAVTRSLGVKSVPVITADETPTSLAGSSKYSQSYEQYPSASHHPPDFINRVIEICHRHNVEIIFPMTELTTALLLKYKTILPEVILPFSDTKTITTLSDKCQLIRLAESLKIPIPQTWHRSPANISSSDLAELPYPLVLKPGMSWLETGNEWIHTTVRFAEDAADAANILNTDPAFYSHPYMLQSCVGGHGEGVFALYDRGHAIAFFAHKRLREKPPRGGVSVLSESAPVNLTLQNYAKKILDHVGWHGIAMVEFKVDSDGNTYLMEVNTRFWGSLQLAVDAGVNFPWLLYKTACGKKPESIHNYKIGTRLRWILGDFDSLYLVLRDQDFSYNEKISAIFSFLAPHPFKTHHEVNRLMDIKPFIWEIKKYFQDITK